MVSKTLFQIFGSLGPGGAIVTLTEKLCRNIFSDAYTLGDEDSFRSTEEEQIKVMRQEYVNGLFDFKGSF